MRARTLLIAITATLLLLAGCGGGSSPKPKPYSGEAPRGTSVAPNPPTRPQESRGTSAAAAQALVRFYLSAFTYASNTGNVTLLRSLGDQDCNSCNVVIKRIGEVYGAGGRLTGVNYSPSAMRTETNDQGMSVYLTINGSDQRLVATRGASPTVNPGVTTKARFDLAGQSGNWVIKQWTRL